MKNWTRAARALGIIGAALVLPCCKDEIGKGDRVPQVTVRMSIALDATQPVEDCTNPAINSDGSIVAFQSHSFNLSPNDSNTLIDIFVKNRLTGSLDNITHVVPLGEFPAWSIDDCTNPAVSGDGRFVAFASAGNYQKLAQPSGPNGLSYIWVCDRSSTGFSPFVRGYSTSSISSNFGGFPVPDADMTDATLSSDGRYLAFASKCTNLTPPNGTGKVQIYITDFLNDTTTLASPNFNLTTLSNQDCLNPRISANGLFVAFASTATNLVSPAPPAFPQIYLGNAAGTACELVSKGPTGLACTNFCAFPVVSNDGRYVSFATYDKFTFPGSTTTPYIARRDRTLATTEVMAEGLEIIGFILPDYKPFGMSEDGQSFAFLSLLPANPPVPTNGLIQAYLFRTGQPLQIASRHLNGQIAQNNCDHVGISGDGRWVVWDTPASNTVDGDTNGVIDVITRGPYE